MRCLTCLYDNLMQQELQAKTVAFYFLRQRFYIFVKLTPEARYNNTQSDICRRGHETYVDNAGAKNYFYIRAFDTKTERLNNIWVTEKLSKEKYI